MRLTFILWLSSHTLTASWLHIRPRSSSTRGRTHGALTLVYPSLASGSRKASRTAGATFLADDSVEASEPPVKHKSRTNADRNNQKENTTSVVTARALAARILSSTRPNTHTSASSRLESLPEWSTLTQRDAGFARLLVTTVERRQGQIDYIISKVSSHQQSSNKRRNHASDRYIHAALSLGIAQLLWLDVSPHAAVSEAVELVKRSKVAAHASKYVNAVLRRLLRERSECDVWAEESLSHNVAPWLWRDWNQEWGSDAALRIVQEAMMESDTCLTVKQVEGLSQEESIDVVAKKFPGVRVLPQGSLRIPTSPSSANSTCDNRNTYRGPISSWPGYNDGSWWVQNPSATIPAKVLYNSLLDMAKSSQTMDGTLRVLDLCSAPGGKAFQLASYNNDKSASVRLQVTAVEVSARRCRRLQENQARLQLPFDIVVADATSWTPTSEPNREESNAGSRADLFHGILLDAPCTATGTASQRPDVLRAGQGQHKPMEEHQEAQYGNLLETQFAMTCHAVDQLLPVGGILVYATCSLQKREGEHQLERLLSRHPQEGVAKLETERIKPHEVPGFERAIDENGWIRILPGMVLGSELDGCCDGFFVSRIRRIA